MQFTDRDGEMPYFIFCNYNRVNKTKVTILLFSPHQQHLQARALNLTDYHLGALHYNYVAAPYIHYDYPTSTIKLKRQIREAWDEFYNRSSVPSYLKDMANLTRYLALDCDQQLLWLA